MVTVSNLTVSQSTVVGPNIVPENIVLYLDAQSLASYPGSGTTWYDISGNSNNFTLVNSPTYIGNGFTFNGTNQYAQCVNTTGGNFGSGSFTLEYVLNIIDQSSTYATIVAKRASTFYNTGNPGYYYRYTGVFQVYDTATPNSGYLGNVGPFNQTIHITHRVVWTGTSVAKSLYENGRLIATATATNPGTNNSDNTIAMTLMRGDGFGHGTVYLIRAYNKALTPLEIYQNFDATRYRYGI